MKEPQRIPLDPEVPRIPSVKKIPMPSVEKELHDLIEDSKQYLSKKEATLNFIEKGRQSKKRYNERLRKED
jgi:hypothetical protein